MIPSQSDMLMELSKVQRYRRYAFWLLSIPLVSLIIINDTYRYGTTYHEAVESLGILAIGLCWIGRLWCASYIAGRKKIELVTVGPYSLTRNPLYLYSVVGAAGIGFASGSLVMGAILGAVCVIVFGWVIRREEAVLIDRFGTEYREYLSRVRRWWPSWSNWRNEPDFIVDRRLLLPTLRDTSLFFLAIPIAEGIDLVHDVAIIPILTGLP